MKNDKRREEILQRIKDRDAAIMTDTITCLKDIDHICTNAIFDLVMGWETGRVYKWQSEYPSDYGEFYEKSETIADLPAFKEA